MSSPCVTFDKTFSHIWDYQLVPRNTLNSSKYTTYSHNNQKFGHSLQPPFFFRGGHGTVFDTDSGPVVQDPQNLCRTTRTSNPVVRWTSKISSPQNCNNNMLQKLKIVATCYRPFHRTSVHNHEWHAFLRSRSIIILVVVLQN